MTEDQTDEIPVLQPFNTCGPCWFNVEENGSHYCTSRAILEDHYVAQHDPRTRVRLVADGRITTSLARTNLHGGAVYHCESFTPPQPPNAPQATGKPVVVEAPASNGGGVGAFLFVSGLGVLGMLGVYQLAQLLWGMFNG